MAKDVRIEKRKVCRSCQTTGISDINCVCVDSSNWDTIELEFEVCNSCEDVAMYPADTEFNRKQWQE